MISYGDTGCLWSILICRQVGMSATRKEANAYGKLCFLLYCLKKSIICKKNETLEI
jgi:hypothetical protein